MARSKSINSLEELFLHELKDIYGAEKDILKALPKMIKAAQSFDLKSAFEEHLEQTQGQVERLEQVFENLGETPKAVSCEAMKGIIKEGASLMEMKMDPQVLDAALIGAAHRVEHYEIAVYGTLCTYASSLGQKENMDLLNETLEEEKETDQKLTELAESGINEEAQEGESMEESKGKKMGRKSGMDESQDREFETQTTAGRGHKSFQ